MRQLPESEAAALLVYPLTTLLGVIISAYLWERLKAKVGAPSNARWHAIFFGGVIGLVLGAKLGYALAEGIWTARAPWPGLRWWLEVGSGKTVAGGLLGAYLGVELAKRAVGHRAPTGDLFAVMTPISLALGRVGCIFAGCCLGVPMQAHWFTLSDRQGTERWPAAPAELLFNAGFAWMMLVSLRRGPSPRWDGQRFHLYLMLYGALRFAHEFVRDTPRLWAGFSGYHVLALALLALGALRFAQRARTLGHPGARQALRLT